MQYLATIRTLLQTICILSQKYFPIFNIYYFLCQLGSHFMDHGIPWSKQRSWEFRDEAIHFQRCFRACQIKRFFFDFVRAQRCNICEVVSSNCKLVIHDFSSQCKCILIRIPIQFHNSHTVSFSSFRHPRCLHHPKIHLKLLAHLYLQSSPMYQFVTHLQ